VLPGILITIAVPITAFTTPSWIYYRRMEYARQRLLGAIDPIVGFVVTVGLAVAGVGYWCFVVGFVAGSVASAIVCVVMSPYALKYRFDRSTLREYATFSWPLVGSGITRLVLVQGSLIVANQTVGIEGVGTIALATGIAVFADRVDAVVTDTMYPAVCAVADRRDLLAEAFVKSNRIALMWAMPFGVGLALFSADLVHFVIGDKWESAIGLLAAFGITCAVGQVAFNWGAFLRVMNDTRPFFVSGIVNLVVFLGVGVPGMILWGLTGYAAGFAAATLAQLVLRGYYMHRLFAGFNMLRQFGRAAAPTVPAAALVLLLRLAFDVHRTLPLALGELAAYGAATIAFTLLFERRLVRELIGYLRGQSLFRQEPASA